MTSSERPTTAGATTVTVPSEFTGPPGCAHGGYLAGLLAELVGDCAVTLFEPVPTGVPLVLEPGPRA